MQSVSFDAVAHRYDATRGYPEEVGRQLAQKIDQAVNADAQTRFLEVGVGTGRIALPLTMLGRQYTGIDISEKMLDHLYEKLHSWQRGEMPGEETIDGTQSFLSQETQGTMRLLVADMTNMPFQDHSFDVVIAVHVFHLVRDWQKALQEIRRVLRPGGIFVRCLERNWEECWEPGQNDIRSQWSKIIVELGGSTRRPGASDREVTAWLQQQGFETEQWPALTWKQEITPRAIFEGVEQRLWTSTMFVPDDLFAISIERLRQWIDGEYGAAIDEKQTQEKGFIISRTQM